MKGYELYSWQYGGLWRFSILVGTNREKSLEEIQSPDTALDGVDALQAALERDPRRAVRDLAFTRRTWPSRPAIPLSGWNRCAATEGCS